MRLRKAASSAFLYKKPPVCDLSPIHFSQVHRLATQFYESLSSSGGILAKKEKGGNLQV